MQDDQPARRSPRDGEQHGASFLSQRRQPIRHDGGRDDMPRGAEQFAKPGRIAAVGGAEFQSVTGVQRSPHQLRRHVAATRCPGILSGTIADGLPAPYDDIASATQTPAVGRDAASSSSFARPAFTPSSRPNSNPNARRKRATTLRHIVPFRIQNDKPGRRVPYPPHCRACSGTCAAAIVTPTDRRRRARRVRRFRLSGAEAPANGAQTKQAETEQA